MQKIFSAICVNHAIPSVQKMIKHTLKIMQQLLHDFQRVFDNFVDTKYHRVKDANFLGEM